MNQQALATVFLRVYGIIIIYSTFASLTAGALLPQLFGMWQNNAEANHQYLLMMGIAWFLQLIFGFAFIFIANKISKFLFPKNHIIVMEGKIEERSIFHIGICLIGIWFFMSHLPSFLTQGFQWYKAQAAGDVYNEFFDEL